MFPLLLTCSQWTDLIHYTGEQVIKIRHVVVQVYQPIKDTLPKHQGCYGKVGTTVESHTEIVSESGHGWRAENSSLSPELSLLTFFQTALVGT